MLVTSYTPYALPGYLVALVGWLAYRRGVRAPDLRHWVSLLVALSALGAVFHAVLLAPSYVGDHPRGRAALTVLSLNTRHGLADAEDVVRLIRSSGAQVAVLVEVTPALEERLVAAGIDDLLPERTGQPGPGASGTMVFAAYPLSTPTSLPLAHHGFAVQVAAPTPFRLVAVHAGQPLNDGGTAWRADWRVLDAVVPAMPGSVVVAGDFNTTLDHGTMRTLLSRGFTDAAREANSGWQPTYPSSWGLIAIDHVLTRGGYRALSTVTPAVPGSDHRALVARLALVP